MAGLRFAFQEVIDEIDAVSHMARSFLSPEGVEIVLPQLKQSLENIRDYGLGNSGTWGIEENLPLLTVPSRGEYERDGRGGESIVAEITSKWDIAPEGLRSKKSRRSRTFSIAGTATTRIRLLSHPIQDKRLQLAMWRMEIGDDHSPGCHFHLQVLGQEEALPVPNTLPIPRLPGFPFSPLLAIEFVLGELFQDRWPQAAGVESHQSQRWRRIQRKRLLRYLEWQLRGLAESGGSPLTLLKALKPEPGLFMENEAR